MKLTKENVYVNLQGKTKEELTDLWEFLTSNGEIVSDNKEYFIETHLKYNNSFIALGSDNAWKWWGSYNKTEVTIEQLKEIIKPMENKEKQLIEEAKIRGFLIEGNEFYSCFDDGNKIRVIKPYDSDSKINLYLDCAGALRYHDGLNNEYDCSLCSNPAIYKNGVWAEILTETLQQQLQKAEAEVKRLQYLIEEENKIKIGDWALELHSNNIIKATEKSSILYLNSKEYCKKITNKELIKLLNDEIK